MAAVAPNARLRIGTIVGGRMVVGDWDNAVVLVVDAGVWVVGSASLGCRIVEMTAMVFWNARWVRSPASMAWPIVMCVRALRLRAKLGRLMPFSPAKRTAT